MDECKPLAVGRAGRVAAWPQGGAVQVGPMKPILKPPRSKRLKLKYDVLLSYFAFKFNLRRYTKARFVHFVTGSGRLPAPGRAVQVDPIKTHIESAWI